MQTVELRSAAEAELECAIAREAEIALAVYRRVCSEADVPWRWLAEQRRLQEKIRNFEKST